MCEIRHSTGLYFRGLHFSDKERQDLEKQFLEYNVLYDDFHGEFVGKEQNYLSTGERIHEDVMVIEIFRDDGFALSELDDNLVINFTSYVMEPPFDLGQFTAAEIRIPKRFDSIRVVNRRIYD